MSTKKLLMIDNYDSFTYNLVQYFGELGAEVCVVRNDACDLSRLERREFAGCVLSPGPSTPDDAGCSLEVVRICDRLTLPLLGVCLGHQAIAQSYGARIVRCDPPVHGKNTQLRVAGTALFRGLPSSFEVTRYHSLVVEPDSMPECLEVSARTSDGIVMAIQHRAKPVSGVQFHPEAVLSEYGREILSNFLAET